MRRPVYVSEEVREWAAHVRGARRFWLLAVAGNLALVFVLVGLPYLRGQARARAAWTRYIELAECMYGDAGHARSPSSEPSPSAGAAFAERVGQASACVGLLRRVAASESMFLLPGLKGAEADVRSAARLTEEALTDVSAPRGGRLSMRPVLGMNLLRTALEAYAKEAGLLEAPLLPAAERAIAVPGNIPLYAGADAVVSLQGTDQTLQALALDRTGISYVEITDRIVARSRLVRPKLLRDVLFLDGRAVLLWGTRRERCANGACIGKTTGIAEVALPLTQIPEPRYLPAHLATRADRGVVVRGTRVDILAERSDALSMQSFLDGASPMHGSPSVAREAMLVARAEGPLALGVRGDALVATSSGKERTLSSLAGASWLTACQELGKVRFAFGSATQLVLGQLEGSEARAARPVEITTRTPVHHEDRTRDDVRVLCGRDDLRAVVLDAHARLIALRCREGCEQHVVAEDVASFAALADLVAYAGDGGQIRVRQLDAEGAPHGVEQTPAPCWAPHGGLCERPLLSELGSRVVLAARDGTDLIALESADRGAHWQQLYGTTPQPLRRK